MLIDINTHIGRWPFLQFGPTTPDSLEARLRDAGVSRACTAAMEAVLAPDPAIEETLLHEQIQGNDFFVHTPYVSPMLHDWRDRLKQARDQFGSPFIRLLPTYHQYDPAGEEAITIATAIGELGMTPALAMRIEDERAHYPLMKVPPPTPEQVVALAHAIAPQPLLVLMAAWREITAIAGGADNTLFDLPFAEEALPWEKLTATIDVGRLHFSSNAPLHYAKAQVRKLDNSGCNDADRQKIRHDNAAALLERAGR